MQIDSFEAMIIHEKDFTIYTERAVLKEDGIILKEGNYKLTMEILPDENNEGDSLGIYFGNKAYHSIGIPVGLEQPVVVSLTLEIKESTEMYFINESDDLLTLNYVNGGLYMSEPLQIINLSKFNPFSFDIELNIPFTEDVQVKVHKVGASISDLTEVPTTIVDKLSLDKPEESTEGNPKLKTVIASTATLFEVNAQYKIEVYNTESLTSRLDSFDFTKFPMMNETNCKVKAVGTRLIVVEFDYPVKNLEELIVTPDPGADPLKEHKELNNFYISYYDKDLILDFEQGQWQGNIETQRPYTYTPAGGGAAQTLVIYPFSTIVSPDHRRIEIQCNLDNFNTGAINKLAVNYNISPGHDLARDLRDYSDRSIANFNKDFTCVREIISAEITTTGVKALSNHEVQVEFDKPVLVKRPLSVPTGTEYIDYFKKYNYFQINKVVDAANNIVTPYTVTSVNRVGSGFNTLLYTLDDSTITNMLPIPQAEIQVGKVMDASGLATNPVIRTIDVPPTTPRFVNAYQETPGPNPTDTKIRVVFNEKMVVGTGVNSAENPANYMLQDPSGKVITLPAGSIAVVAGKNNMEFTLTIPSVLPTGEYKLTAFDPIEDFTGQNIETATKTINIVDYVAPIVEKVIATKTAASNTTGKINELDNGIVIMFDKQMNVTQGDNASVLNPQNYLMEYYDTAAYSEYIYSSEVNNTATQIENIYDSRWIRYTLPPTATTNFIDTNTANPSIIHAGYVQGQTVYFIRSKSGNIYRLCNFIEIDELVNPLDISKGTAQVTNDYQIKVTMNNTANSYVNNLFGILDYADFDATTDGGTSYIKAIGGVIDGYPFNSIVLDFPAGSFDSSETITLRVNAAAPKSKDIFSKTIVGNTTATVSNDIPTALKGIGVLNVDSTTSDAIIELLFEKPVSDFAATDFETSYINGATSILLDETTTGTPTAAIASGRPNTVQLTVDLSTVGTGDNVLNNLFVSSSTSTIIPVKIRDDGGKKITPFVKEQAQILKVNNLAWKYVAAGTADEYYELILQFNKPVSDKYIGTVTATTVTPDTANKVLTVAFTGGNLGRFALSYSKAITDPATNVNTWTQTISLNTAKDTLTIKLAPPAGDTLFDTAAAINPGTERLLVTYTPYVAANSDNALIVNEEDTIQLIRLVQYGSLI